MPLRAVSPVPMVELIALYEANGPLKPVTASAVRLQAARSVSFGFYHGEGLAAAALLYPCEPERAGEDLYELVFACRPGFSGVLFVMHMARLARARLTEAGAIRVRARVRVSHRPGQRLARLAGLAFSHREGAHDVYEWNSATAASSDPPPAAAGSVAEL